MKFICQSCARGFEFGAPKGMQLPCPACGGMLVDEESAAGAPAPPSPAPPSPSMPAASAFASGAAAEPPEDEISLDAAEAFMKRSEQGEAVAGGDAQLTPEPPVPQPMAPQPPEPAVPQQWPTQAPSSEQLPAAAASADQLPAAAPSSEQWPAAGQEAAWPEGVGAEGATPQQEQVGADGLPLEEESEEEFEEESASPFILILGYVLFAICFVGLMVMGYLLKLAYDELKAAGDPTAMRAKIISLTEKLDQQRQRGTRLQKDLDKAFAREKGYVDRMASLEAKAGKVEDVEKRRAEESSRLEAELASSRNALSTAQTENRSLRELKDKVQIEAAKARGRLAAGEQVLRAVGLLKRPERWNEALAYLDSALRRAGGFKEALWLRGILLAKLRRGEEAVRDFDRLDEITRGEGAAGHVRALVAAGDVCRTQLADRERAAKYYGRAGEAAPDSPFAKLAESRSRVMAGQPEAGRRIAERAAREAEKRGEDASQLRLLVAEIMAEGSNNRREIIEEVGKVIAVDPDNVEALDLRGGLLLAEKHPDKAVSDLSRAAILDPVDTKRLIVLGKALLDTKDAGRHAEAESILERAVKALPKSKEGKVELGRALVARGRNEDAITRLTEVITVDPTNGAAFRLRGEARIALKRHREALRDVLKALQLNGRDARVRVLLARVYILLRDPAQAVAHASVAVDLTERRDPGALAMFARAYAASGDYARATIEIRNAVRLRPDSETYKQLLRQYADAAKKGRGR